LLVHKTTDQRHAGCLEIVHPRPRTDRRKDVRVERPGSKATLVHFRCTNLAHVRPASQRGDTLTLFEGLWAYCPFDVRAGDHRWEPTGGVTMESLLNEAG